MDKILDLLSSLETAIRYLLSGVTITGIALLSISNPVCILEWAQTHQAMAIVTTVSVGFILFSFYRLIFWVIGDLVAWKVRASAPSLYPHKSWLYDKPFTDFLLWKHSEQISKSLGGYLTYRWAVAHFAVLTACVLIVALVLCQDDSLIAKHPCVASIFAVCFLVFGLWQHWFLFRVERELCRITKKLRTD